MKITKGLLLTIPLFVTGCFDEPDYPVTPQIEYIGINFTPGTTDSPTESLTFTIAFKDGDGDLGLSPSEIEEPYQDVFYALADNGNIIDISKETVLPNLPQFVKVPAGVSGKLVTSRTLEDPIYTGKLPSYVDEKNSCKDYRVQQLYIREADAHIIDASYLAIDTMTIEGIGIVYVVEDTFYKKNNPNHQNIEVEFLVKQNDGQYKVFDWEKEYCETGFNQRFPRLADKSGPLEGTLDYALTSIGIRETFGIQTLKLKIKVRDRALHVSNEIETPDFTLD